jgi:hypothetical protein
MTTSTRAGRPPRRRVPESDDHGQRVRTGSRRRTRTHLRAGQRCRCDAHRWSEPRRVQRREVDTGRFSGSVELFGQQGREIRSLALPHLREPTELQARHRRHQPASDPAALGPSTAWLMRGNLIIGLAADIGPHPQRAPERLECIVNPPSWSPRGHPANKCTASARGGAAHWQGGHAELGRSAMGAARA